MMANRGTKARLQCFAGGLFSVRKGGKMKRVLLSIVATMAVGVLCIGQAPEARANANVQLTQSIAPGVLSVSVLDASEALVAAPSVGMTALAATANCRPTGSAGLLGVNSQRIYVDNPGAADNGWSLSIAATGGPTAAWSSGGDIYDYNDQTGGGCSDGADADSRPGLLSVNPATGGITPACGGVCSNTGVGLGVSGSYDEGMIDAIELMSAGAVSDNVWRGYLMGASLTQSIPAGQPAGSYAINMTATVTAL